MVARTGLDGVVQVQRVTFSVNTVAATSPANTILFAIPVTPDGFALHSLYVEPSTSFDTNGAPTLAIDYGLATDAEVVSGVKTSGGEEYAANVTDARNGTATFITTPAVFGAGVQSETAAGVGLNLIGKVSTAAATGASGTMIVTVVYTRIPS